jgi:hypothetical protein
MCTAPDDGWGKPCLAYNVQARFSARTLDEMALLQDGLQALSPLPLNLSPRHSLHVSIYALVPVRWPDTGKADYWNERSAQAISDLGTLCGDRRRFALCFEQLRITSSAIVAIATETPDMIADIRRHFDRLPGHPSFPKPRYDIVHTTLARFGSNTHVPESVVRRISTMRMSLAADIDQVQLVRERVYPSLETDDIARFALR